MSCLRDGLAVCNVGFPGAADPASPRFLITVCFIHSHHAESPYIYSPINR